MDDQERLARSLLAGLAVTAPDPERAARRVAVCLRAVREEHFPGAYRSLFRLVTTYFGMVGSVPSPSEVDELVRDVPRLALAERVEIARLWRELPAGEPDCSEQTFRFLCARLASAWREATLGRSLSIAQAILHGSARIDGRVLSQYGDARQYLSEQLALVDRMGAAQSSAGDVRQETRLVSGEYAAAKRGGAAALTTGWTALDQLTGGIAAGELWLFAGFTGTGKSKLAYNLAYHAAFVLGRHVVFATSEAARDQVRRNLIVRHTHSPRFECPGGLDYEAVRRGTLDAAGERVLAAALSDLSEQSGTVWTLQLPYRATVESLREQVLARHRTRPVDLLIVDYLGLLAGTAHRATDREEQSDVLLAAKRLATDGVEGVPLPVVSPWQISRKGEAEARITKRYLKSALAETAQAERSADLILAVYREEATPEVLSAQVLKYRDGREGDSFALRADFAHAAVLDPLPVVAPPVFGLDQVFSGLR